MKEEAKGRSDEYIILKMLQNEWKEKQSCRETATKQNQGTANKISLCI